MAQNGGKINPPCDTSVIVPCFGDAATGAAGEPAILNGGSLATIGRGTVERRLDRVDSVAVAVDVLDRVDRVVQRVLHNVDANLINAVSQGELEVTHGVLC